MKARQVRGLNVGMYGLCLAGLWVGSLIATASAGDVTTDTLSVWKTATVYDKLSVQMLSPAAPTSGLILYYSLNSSATPIVDESGNNVPATVIAGGPSWTSAGLKNGAFIFNGSSNDIEATPPSSPWVSNKLSISLWAKYNATGGTRILFSISSSVDGSGSKYWIESGGWNDNGIRFGIQGVTTGVGSGVTPVLGQWYHIVATYDGATMAIYVNGILCNSFAMTYTQTSTMKVRLGYDVGQTGFSGTLDEVRVYNRPLSALEVACLYYFDKGGVTTTDGTITVQNGIQQSSPSATSTLMGGVRIGTSSPLQTGEKLLVDGKARITGQLELGGQLIKNLATPVVGGDAANKAYVDSAISTSLQNLPARGDIPMYGYP